MGDWGMVEFVHRIGQTIFQLHILSKLDVVVHLSVSVLSMLKGFHVEQVFFLYLGLAQGTRPGSDRIDGSECDPI